MSSIILFNTIIYLDCVCLYCDAVFLPKKAFIANAVSTRI